jgi:hypothetical protein
MGWTTGVRFVAGLYFYYGINPASYPVVYFLMGKAAEA